MKTLVRLDPFEDIFRFSEAMESLLRSNPNEATQVSQTMPLDVMETETQFVVKASMPGVKPENLKIEVEDQVLTIRGEHEERVENSGDKFYRKEIRRGTLARSLRLPNQLDFDSAEANMEHGIVSVTFNKITPEKPKALSIPVKTA